MKNCHYCFKETDSVIEADGHTYCSFACEEKCYRYEAIKELQYKALQRAHNAKEILIKEMDCSELTEAREHAKKIIQEYKDKLIFMNKSLGKLNKEIEKRKEMK